MKDDRDYSVLLRMIDHCDRIFEIQKSLNNGFDSFANNPVVQDAINMNIFQIGELSNHLSDELKDSFPDIPWHNIYGIRNIIAHAYIIVDKSKIWETVENDIPVLYERICSIAQSLGTGLKG